MKKYISTFLMMAMMAVSVPMLAGTADAQRSCNTRSSRTIRSSERRTYSGSGYYGNGYTGGGYYDNGYNNSYSGGNGSVQRVYDRHRQAVNIGAGTAAGALLGALIGGKRGALIGAAVGAAGGAVVTSKQAPRNYYRYR
jgi:hypothetical protein